jgi:hypothetical protein
MSDIDLSNMTQIDVQVILRVMRAERDKLTEVKMLLEERLRAIGDGEKTGLQAEINLIESEIHAVGVVITKVWNIITAIKH